MKIKCLTTSEKSGLGRSLQVGVHFRTNGIKEEYVTGKEVSFQENSANGLKQFHIHFGNPLYHWTHLELQRYFGIEEPLSPKTEKEIYEKM